MSDERIIPRKNGLEVRDGYEAVGGASFAPSIFRIGGVADVPILRVGIRVKTRERGLGSRLMRELMDMPEVKSAPLIELSTTARNLGHRMYRNSGFVDAYACPWAVKLLDFGKAFRRNVEMNIEHARREGLFERPEFRRCRYSARFAVDDYPDTYVRGCGSVAEFSAGNVALTVETDATTMVKLWNGRIDSCEATQSGALRLTGRRDRFLKLARIVFPGLLTGVGVWTYR